MGHLIIGPVYRVGQVEIEHSSKTSLFQETEGENLPRESDFRSLLVMCFQSFQGLCPWTPPGLCQTHWGLTGPHQDSARPTGGSQDPTRTLPDPLGAHSTPVELSNRYPTKMRIRGQRTAFEIHYCTKMQGFIVVTCSFWGEFELNLNIICLRS